MTPNYYFEQIVEAMFKLRYPAIAEHGLAPKFYVNSHTNERDYLWVHVGFIHEGKRISRRGFGCNVDTAYRVTEEYVALIDKAVMDLVLAGSDSIFKSNKNCIISTGETVEQSLNP